MKPVLLDTFCKAGGAGMGYSLAGYQVIGIDIEPQPNYPFPFLQMDAIEALQRLIAGEGLTFSDGVTYYLRDIAAIHASPPCQGYSIMNNLPWIREREYPLLILPTRLLLEDIGRPYVIENVAGARFGAKGLKTRGLEEHGMKAGWLCGGMFSLPIYRHRYFETNWFWYQPGHPKHTRATIPHPNDGGPKHHGRSHPNPVNTGWRAGHDGVEVKERRRGQTASPPMAGHSAGNYFNGAQKSGVADGHAAGWKIAAESMGIDWMKRSELTQAVPPVMTRYIGEQLMSLLLLTKQRVSV